MTQRPQGPAWFGAVEMGADPKNAQRATKEQQRAQGSTKNSTKRAALCMQMEGTIKAPPPSHLHKDKLLERLALISAVSCRTRLPIWVVEGRGRWVH